MTKPPDEPDFIVGQNASRPQLVHVAVASGQDGYDITPERAERLAHQLVIAAHAARSTPKREAPAATTTTGAQRSRDETDHTTVSGGPAARGP